MVLGDGRGDAQDEVQHVRHRAARLAGIPTHDGDVRGAEGDVVVDLASIEDQGATVVLDERAMGMGFSHSLMGARALAVRTVANDAWAGACVRRRVVNRPQGAVCPSHMA